MLEFPCVTKAAVCCFVIVCSCTGVSSRGICKVRVESPSTHARSATSNVLPQLEEQRQGMVHSCSVHIASGAGLGMGLGSLPIQFLMGLLCFRSSCLFDHADMKSSVTKCVY